MGLAVAGFGELPVEEVVGVSDVGFGAGAIGFGDGEEVAGGVVLVLAIFLGMGGVSDGEQAVAGVVGILGDAACLVGAGGFVDLVVGEDYAAPGGVDGVGESVEAVVFELGGEVAAIDHFESVATTVVGILHHDPGSIGGLGEAIACVVNVGGGVAVRVGDGEHIAVWIVGGEGDGTGIFAGGVVVEDRRALNFGETIPGSGIGSDDFHGTPSVVVEGEGDIASGGAGAEEVADGVVFELEVGLDQEAGGMFDDFWEPLVGFAVARVVSESGATAQGIGGGDNVALGVVFGGGDGMLPGTASDGHGGETLENEATGSVKFGFRGVAAFIDRAPGGAGAEVIGSCEGAVGIIGAGDATAHEIDGGADKLPRALGESQSSMRSFLASSQGNKGFPAFSAMASSKS